jgi:hypothetical protein
MVFVFQAHVLPKLNKVREHLYEVGEVAQIRQAIRVVAPAPVQVHHTRLLSSQGRRLGRQP